MRIPTIARTFLLLVLILLMLNSAFGQIRMVSYTQTTTKTISKPLSTLESAATLKTDMRKLWEDHVVWTRNVIFCLVDGLPGTEQAVRRLLQNQEDIGNAFKPFYGEVEGNKLTELLKIHVDISAEVVRAANAGNSAALDEANKRWYVNADRISELLNRVNVKWALADLITMMNEHLKLTTDEAEQRIKRNYAGDVIAYDKVRDEALKMSDMLSAGIVKQFPKKFHTSTVKKAKK